MVKVIYGASEAAVDCKSDSLALPGKLSSSRQKELLAKQTSLVLVTPKDEGAEYPDKD